LQRESKRKFYVQLRFSENVQGNVEQCCGARQATDDSIIQRTRFAYCITKATGTQSEYAIYIAFPLQQWSRKRPQCYVIRALSVFLIMLRHCESLG